MNKKVKLIKITEVNSLAKGDFVTLRYDNGVEIPGRVFEANDDFGLTVLLNNSRTVTLISWLLGIPTEGVDDDTSLEMWVDGDDGKEEKTIITVYRTK